MLAYFLKINIAIALFYAFYRLFFYKDTFFAWRRIALMCFLGISAVYPLLNIQDWVKEQKPMTAMADIYAGVVLPEFEYTAKVDHIEIVKNIIMEYAGYLYIGVALLLFFRFLIQFGGILRLAIFCKKKELGNVIVHVLPHAGGPFSFFKWIFLNPESHSEEELNEILTHEETHANQWHSIDVLISEIACIICWFNPFIWLLKREIRSNLEYLADNKVLESGHDSKSYQYHLLGLSHQNKAAATIYNNFNVLPLKKRIKMMNKKRTKQIGRTKYIMFLPLAALLLIISNIETVARSTGKIAKAAINSVVADESNATQDQGAAIRINELQSPQQKKTTPTEAAKDKNGNQVYDMVEQPPSFPGGQDALMNYISTNLKYPASAAAKSIQGRVIAQFVVCSDGSISNAHVLKTLDPDLDAEALRVINAMPAWKPGMQKGKAVSVKYTIPIIYRLTENKQVKKAGEPISQIKETVVVGYAPKGEQTPTKVYGLAEDMPKFPGGINALMEYISKSLRYPVEAAKEKKEGKAVIQMVIDEKGNVVSPQIIRSTGSPLLDAEAIRVVSNMPKWEAGKEKGEAVAVKYTIPINFRLQ